MYNNYLVGLESVIINSHNDFTAKALENGIRDVLSDAIFEEIIEPDLDPIGTKQKDDEYRKQSEFISGEYLEKLLEADEQLAKLKNTPNTRLTPVAPIEGIPASISKFRKNPSNKIYGRIKVLGNSEEKIAAAKLRCSVCGSEEQHQVFDPPIDVGKINQHIVSRGRCTDEAGYCGRLNTFQIVKETVSVRNLVLADLDYPDTVLEIVDVRDFDVMKGDIVKIEGDIEYSGDTKKTRVLRCRRLEVLQHVKAAQPLRLSDHNEIKSLESLEMKDNRVDEGLARRRLAFSRYKKFYDKNSDSPDERFDLVIQELINEDNQDIKNLVTVKGVVKSNLRDNRQLQNFLESLLIPQNGDDGVLIRTGTRPVKLRWQPNQNIQALAE